MTEQPKPDNPLARDDKPEARKHHYVPSSLLAGFTAEGTDEGRLFVVDQRARKTWWSTPKGAAHERDLYRVEIPDVAPNAFEEELSRIEGRGATVIRQIRESLEPPVGEALTDLVTFTAVMATRTPPNLDHHKRFEEELYRRMLEMQIRHPKGFEALKERARTEARPIDHLTQDELLASLDKSDLVFPSTWNVQQLLVQSEVLFSLLAARQWSLLVPAEGAGHFICSDMPAVVHDPTPRPEFYGPSFVAPESEFTMPLSQGFMLCGRFEKGSATYVVDARSVAALNNRTRMYAKQLYSPLDDFRLLRGGTICGLADLLQAKESDTPSATAAGKDVREEEDP